MTVSLLICALLVSQETLPTLGYSQKKLDDSIYDSTMPSSYRYRQIYYSLTVLDAIVLVREVSALLEGILVFESGDPLWLMIEKSGWYRHFMCLMLFLDIHK